MTTNFSSIRAMTHAEIMRTIWRRDGGLRWLRHPTARCPDRLQEAFRNECGEVEWRDIPVALDAALSEAEETRG